MELEHRSSKSRYRRTSRKEFERQLSQVERRQARIRRIRQRLNERIRAEESFIREKRPELAAEGAYHIGKTQNHPVDLRVLGKESCYDPAGKVILYPYMVRSFSWAPGTQDFTRNLKKHLLPRISERLQISPETSAIAGCEDPSQAAQNYILIKDDRIYNHKLARFYYTTYDAQRSEDIINPKMTHCNIMLLSHPERKNADSLDTSLEHPFIYARVIGVYHVNVIYIGPGAKEYKPMRFDFLHVRWFQLDSPPNQTPRKRGQTGWSSCLDRLSFPPMAEADSFGFLDPSLVLRTCHVIPAFHSGQCYADGVGLSAMARDKNDWKGYYLNR